MVVRLFLRTKVEPVLARPVVACSRRGVQPVQVPVSIAAQSRRDVELRHPHLGVREYRRGWGYLWFAFRSRTSFSSLSSRFRILSSFWEIASSPECRPTNGKLETSGRSFKAFLS